MRSVVSMPFQPEDAKKRNISKSLYISEKLADRVEKLAAENGTSFSNMVVSMIEYCLKELEQK